MKTSALGIITIVLSISIFTWLVSIWQYDAMMSSMMTFSRSPAALSLFVVIWTAGMAAMMFPAIIPMIVIYNRFIDNTSNSNARGNKHHMQILYQKSEDAHNNSIDSNKQYKVKGNNEGKRNITKSLRYVFRPKPYEIALFVASYLAIWAMTGIVLLVGWSFFLDTMLLQLGLNVDITQQQQQVIVSTIYGIVLIISGLYQFSSLKTRCLGYCESPLSFFMRRWQKGKVGALKMGTHHGLYCLGCCWPYFLLMVALGWMNVLWMGLFAAIIFVEKVWPKGSRWIVRITGIAFIVIGILSVTGTISLPSDSMNSMDNNSDMMMSMDMSSSSSDSMIMSDGKMGTDNTRSNVLAADID
jgi:predicted metal-binding membrane protein